MCELDGPMPILNSSRTLMAKTREAGCTEEEALSALDKVQALKDTYEVTEDELRLSKEEAAILRIPPSEG